MPLKTPFRLLAALLFGISAAAFAQAPKTAADIPVETFFKRAEYSNMALSPAGDKLAAIVPFRGRNNLVVIDLKTRTPKVITGYDSFDVANFEWISDTRLCLRAADGQDVSGNFQFRGAACVDHDGRNQRNFQFRQWNVLERADDGSPNAFVATNERTRNSVDVYRMNTQTGRGELLTADSPGEVTQWVLDRNNVPRVAVSSPEPKVRYGLRPSQVWYRDGADAKWEKLYEFDFDITGDSITPIAFDYDNQTLYISHNIGRDKKAIYKYDTKARKMGELVFEHPLVDVAGGLIFDRKKKKLIGIQYNADVVGVKWLDPDLDKLQKMLDATYPKTTNVIQGAGEGGTNLLVRTFSGSDPGMFYLLDRSKPAIEPLMKTREWLDPALMSERRFITYRARDGMTIAAWVTIPKNSDGKNLPLVVNIHGGPYLRVYSQFSHWGRPEAQFFASRGYVVLEPEPRGSTGFGREHYVKSFKQWGQSMQDDITDGALHLVKEGIVDKNRMCLFGGSYGGYASAMGIVKDPDLWKCSVPIVAVTDLFLLQGASYTDAADYAETEAFKKVIGDPKVDKEMFTRVSPALQGSRIKAPVLIAMGSEDVRVPLVHGESLRDAIRKNGGKAELVVYNGEAHGCNLDENVFDFYRRVEKFLAENLKK
jgi:dipeptidyl aminopeptidase/acylaminoacyl peptidase